MINHSQWILVMANLRKVPNKPQVLQLRWSDTWALGPPMETPKNAQVPCLDALLRFCAASVIGKDLMDQVSVLLRLHWKPRLLLTLFTALFVTLQQLWYTAHGSSEFWKRTNQLWIWVERNRRRQSIVQDDFVMSKPGNRSIQNSHRVMGVSNFRW